LNEKSLRERILVTGAAGFIGRRLIALLSGSGYEVIALDRSPNAGQTVSEYLEGDIVTSQVLKQVEPPISQIVHLAANVFDCVNESCLIDNVYSTYLLSQYAPSWNVKRIILASTSGVYQYSNKDLTVNENYPVEPEGFYALTKYLAETVLQVSSTPIIILRFTYLYGENNSNGALAKAIQSIEQGLSPEVRKENRDYLYIGDVTDAIHKALQYKGLNTIFHFGTGQLISMTEIVEKVLEIKGSSLKVKISGQRYNLALDCTLAKNELGWSSSRNILDDLKSGHILKLASGNE
jgi:nucleoside-diphosphate-sugar epimerase